MVEEVANTRSTNTHKHLDKVRTRHREEGYISLTRNGLSQEGLTRSRRAYKECALRNLSSESLIFVGLLEEVYNLHNLDFGLLQARNILECYSLLLLLVKDLGTRLANIHNVATATTTCATHHRAHKEYPHHDDKQPRQELDEVIDPATLRAVVLNDYGLGHNTLLRSLGLGLFDLLGKILHIATRIEADVSTRCGQILKAVIICQCLLSLLGKENRSLLLVKDIDTLDISLLDKLRD